MPFWAPFLEAEKCTCSMMIFLKIFISAKTSLKNQQFGERFVFFSFNENIFKIELSSARHTQNAFFGFSKESTFFMQQILKTVLSHAPAAHFCGFARLETIESKNRFLFCQKLHVTM